VVGKQDMTMKLNAQLQADRLGNANSALTLSTGYGTVPPGVYFDPDTNGYTIMVWVKIIEIGNYPRIIEFGNGTRGEIQLLAQKNTTQIRSIGNGGTTSYDFYSTGTLTLNKWSHVTLTGTRAERKFYFDGVLKGTQTSKNSFYFFSVERLVKTYKDVFNSLFIFLFLI